MLELERKNYEEDIMRERRQDLPSWKIINEIFKIDACLRSHESV